MRVSNSALSIGIFGTWVGFGRIACIRTKALGVIVVRRLFTAESPALTIH